MSPQTDTLVGTVHGENIQPALQIREFCTHEAREITSCHHAVSTTECRHSLHSRPLGLLLPIT